MPEKPPRLIDHLCPVGDRRCDQRVDYSSLIVIGQVLLVPFLLLSLRQSLVCMQECKGNKNTVLAVTLRGGHVAFLQGLWPFGTAWMDQVAMQFFSACSEMPQISFDAIPCNELGT